jgi:hypothetical protein
MNAEFVESVKSNLKKQSKSVELTIKNMDNMLGLRVQIANSGQQPLDCNSGADITFFDAILDATLGNMDALDAYDTTKHTVETGEKFKQEVLEDFLGTQLPVMVRQLQMREDSNILEVVFQLGYRRKLRIYFSFNDTIAIDMLKKSNLIEAE